MSGNTIGKAFCLTTFGESHGPGIGGIIDGCPPGLEISLEDIQSELNRRKPGQSHYTTQRKEADHIKILSGIFEGKTTGAPIGLWIENEDAKSKDYEDLKNVFRPGHGDYTYFKKYGVRDYRGGGRASARETAVRVAGGAIAKKWLKQNHQIEIRAYLAQMGDLKIHSDIQSNTINWHTVSNNAFFCPDASLVPQLEAHITELRKMGDSVGARINGVATGVPAGLGEPVYDKLDSDMARALMSINAVKGVELGAGFESITQRGSVHQDEMTAHPTGFLSNHAGGILAGISTGQDILVSCAFKPTSSILIPGQSVNALGEMQMVSTKGRHDPCVGMRAVPIVEAMMALVLIDHCLRWYGNK